MQLNRLFSRIYLFRPLQLSLSSSSSLSSPWVYLQPRAFATKQQSKQTLEPLSQNKIESKLDQVLGDKPSTTTTNTSSSSSSSSSPETAKAGDTRYAGNRSFDNDGGNFFSSASGAGGRSSSSSDRSVDDQTSGMNVSDRPSGSSQSSSFGGRSSTSSNEYLGSRSVDDRSSSETLGSGYSERASRDNRSSDSGNRSGIGETLHKISDKISETFSGGGRDRDQNQGHAGNKMMRSSRPRDPMFSPFDLTNIFRSNFFDNLSESFGGQSMRTDIVERDSDYRVICDMPGVDKKDININLRNNYLEIYGERKEGYDRDDSDQTVHQERRFGSYTRRLSLPNDISQDVSSIKAKCNNGVLTVTIPKSQQSPRDRYNINIE